MNVSVGVDPFVGSIDVVSPVDGICVAVNGSVDVERDVL